jgi:DDE superfamily endonuclease
VTIEEDAIQASFEFMGSDFWDYGKGSGKKYGASVQLLRHVWGKVNVKMSYCTLQRWLDYYRQFGEAPARSKRNKNKRTSIGKLRTTGRGAFNRDHELVLHSIIEHQPQLYLDEMQDEMVKLTGKLWSTSTIWMKLHTLGYSLKTIVHRAKQQSQRELNDYHSRMRDRVTHPRQCLFLDETARGENASRRRRAWSPVGITPIIPAAMVRDFDKRYTLLAACNWEGFVFEGCQIVEREQSKDDKNPDRGTVDSDRFIKYIKECVVPCLGKFVLSEPNSIVIMDNASIHNSIVIRDLIEAAGAILVYTAPYFPEFNPIEFMFGEYKKSLRRISHDRQVFWYDVHYMSLQVVTPDMAKKFFLKCEVPGMKEWFENRERRLEHDDLVLFPLNELHELWFDFF